MHQALWNLVAQLNRVYRDTPALWEHDDDPAGFEWIASDPGQQRRRVPALVGSGEALACLVNFGGNPVGPYRIGLPFAGVWTELLNSDAVEFGGSGVGNYGAVTATAEPWHGQPASVELTLPPLAALYLKRA